MKIYKISNMQKVAVTAGEFRDVKSSIKKVKDDIKSIKSDVKKNDKRLDKIEKAIDKLNIGSRVFWQERTVFTSLQRKMERLESLEQEWNKYKKEMKDDIRKQVEKATRARVRTTVHTK